MHEAASRDDGPQAGDGRRAPRRGLFLSAILCAGDRSYPIRIRNISKSGAKIEGDRLPHDGDIEIRRADHLHKAEIVWANGKSRGIRFTRDIELADWIPSLNNSGQQQVDQRIAQARAAPLAPVEAADDSLPIDKRVAEEMTLASRRLGQTLDKLSEFTPLLARNATELQELEVLQQLLVGLARILEDEDPVAAAQKFGMDDVRRRLLR